MIELTPKHVKDFMAQLTKAMCEKYIDSGIFMNNVTVCKADGEPDMYIPENEEQLRHFIDNYDAILKNGKVLIIAISAEAMSLRLNLNDPNMAEKKKRFEDYVKKGGNPENYSEMDHVINIMTYSKIGRMIIQYKLLEGNQVELITEESEWY